MARADFRFCYSKRVRYAEVDPQGVVFNSRYLEYLDIGVTEYWRAVGLPLAGDGSFEAQVVKNTLEYRKPLRLDELFDICVAIVRVGRSSMTTRWEVHGAGAEDLRVTGETISAHVDLAAGRPLPVPDRVVALFEAYEGRPLRMEKAA
jgi:acyl-CoA thioester hydrolase